MDFFSWIGSAILSLWECVKGIFSGQGTANEAGSATSAPFTSSGVAGLVAAGLGAAMLINPSGTGHHLEKVVDSAMDVVGSAATSAVDNISTPLNNVIQQPWFWVAAAGLLLFLMKD